MTKEAVKKRRAVRKCQICGRSSRKLKRIIRHHVLYDPEIVVDLCYGCHSWLHNTARSWNHPFVKKYGKDIGPWHFAIRVCMVYDEANRQYAATHAEDEPWGKK